MSTDFMEDDEQDQGMESSQNRNTETESEPSDLEEQVDTEVIIGKNNNASVGGRAVKRLGNTCQIEGSVAAQVMEMNKSMNVFKEYVDNKFANLAKLSEVEREIAEKQRVLEELKARGEQSNIIQPREFNEDAMSEMTIYWDAVRCIQDRGSSSSEDQINTSDEMEPNEVRAQKIILKTPNKIPRFERAATNNIHPIVEWEMSMEVRSRSRSKSIEASRANTQDEDEQDRHEVTDVIDRPCVRSTPRDREKEMERERDAVAEKSANMIREAENAKARIYKLPGKQLIHNKPSTSMEIDEGYKLVALHFEDSLKDKIINCEYVDFSKLLPKNRDMGPYMQIVNRGGQAWWEEIGDRVQTVGNYKRWEQAFRVYADVYTSVHIGRGSELIQFNHVIHSLSPSFTWDNIYAYDCEFRRHMSRNPQRNWGIILQQAYTMLIKDRLTNFSSNPGKGNQDNTNNFCSMGNKKICYSFNRGNCKFGSRCKFDHRCGMCGKFGHGGYNCRKAASIAAARQQEPDNKRHSNKEVTIENNNLNM